MLCRNVLRSAVQIAHDRFQADDRFTVQGDDHAEHAVRAGVLRPQADYHLFGGQVGHMHAHR